MDTTALIPVFTGDYDTQLCNARDLHAFLDVGRDFSNWITGRIDEYGFIEGEDYSPVLANRSDGRAGKRRIDYHLTLDMAKELAMVENNAQGRMVRRYFIRAEKELRSRMMEELREKAQHVLPIPGVISKARDGMSFKDTLVLQIHGRNTMTALLDTDRPAERYNLYCQLRQINETLGIPTQTLEEINDDDIDLSLGLEKLGENLLEGMIGKPGGSTKGKEE